MNVSRASMLRRPRAPASGAVDRDGYAPVTGADVTDLQLLPGEFRAFRAEVRQLVDILGRQILGKLETIQENQAIDHDAIKALAALQSIDRNEIQALKRRVAKLERQVLNLRRAKGNRK